MQRPKRARYLRLTRCNQGVVVSRFALRILHRAAHVEDRETVPLSHRARQQPRPAEEDDSC
jgi:hypothetical protein